jgi:hypothetical protein
MKYILLLLSTFLLTSCWLCQDDTLVELPSPNGKYIAKAGKYGCVTNTGFYGKVTVSVAGPPADANTARCGDPGTSIASANFDNDQSVSLAWASNSELIVRVHGPHGTKITQDMSCTYDKSVRILVEQ